jgi:sugar lactone lactonase YvrE
MKVFLTNNGKLNESVFWHKLNKKFYWIDIEKHYLYSFDPLTNKTISIKTTFKPCCIQPYIDENNILSNNILLCASKNSIGYYNLDNQEFNIKVSLDNHDNIRFNDGKINKNGVLYIGTMDIRDNKKQIGNIYKFENDELTIIEKNIGITNGISFDNNNNMYFSDSLTKTLYKKNLDTNKNIIIKKYQNDETPDGGLFHNEIYYSCIWGGHRIDMYKNDKIFNQIKLPYKFITCCDFNNNNQLFVSCYFN